MTPKVLATLAIGLALFGLAFFGTAKWSRLEVLYPEGWPLDELNAPADSIRYILSPKTDLGSGMGFKRSYRVELRDKDDLQGPNDYWIYFKSALDWPATLQHCDESLLPAGFQICGEDRTVLNSAPPVRATAKDDEIEYLASYVSNDMYRCVNVYKTHICYIFVVRVYPMQLNTENSVGTENKRKINLNRPVLLR